MKSKNLLATKIPLALAIALPLIAHADTIETALNAYTEGNYTEALGILQHLAEEGEPHAQYNLAAMYDAGSGVEEDNEIAVKWYLAAAEQGVTSAAFNLGNMYRQGQGVSQSHREAIRWYRFAADKGGIADAEYNLGIMRENGLGIERDLQAAISWYNRAAGQGLVYAQHRLGELYAKGEDVEEDPFKAFTWFRRAALQGHQPAKVELAALEADLSAMRRHINGSNVNLRTEPSTTSDVVERLQRGQSVLALAAQGDWVKVNVIGTQPLHGWVHGSLLE